MRSEICHSLFFGKAEEREYKPDCILLQIAFLLKNNQQYVLHDRRFRKGRKTRTDRRRNTKSCDPKTFWKGNTDSGNKSLPFFHRSTAKASTNLVFECTSPQKHRFSLYDKSHLQVDNEIAAFSNVESKLIDV